MPLTQCYPVSLTRFRSFGRLTETIDADQGQGGGMASEDGVGLGILLSNIQSRDEIRDRLRLFQDLRLKRVSAMVIFSSVGQDQAALIADQVRPFVDGPLPRKLPVGIFHYTESQADKQARESRRLSGV